MSRSSKLARVALTSLALAGALGGAAAWAQFGPVPSRFAIPQQVKPDLVVSGFAIVNAGVSMSTPCAPGKPRFDLGPCINPQFVVTVTNQGPGFANGNTGVQLSLNGAWVLGASLHLDQLAPGGSIQVLASARLGPCDTVCNGWATSFTFGARVDGANVIDEADEANNLWMGEDLRACRHCP